MSTVNPLINRPTGLFHFLALRTNSAILPDYFLFWKRSSPCISNPIYFNRTYINLQCSNFLYLTEPGVLNSWCGWDVYSHLSLISLSWFAKELKILSINAAFWNLLLDYFGVQLQNVPAMLFISRSFSNESHNFIITTSSKSQSSKIFLNYQKWTIISLLVILFLSVEYYSKLRTTATQKNVKTSSPL